MQHNPASQMLPGSRIVFVISYILSLNFDRSVLRLVSDHHEHMFTFILTNIKFRIKN